MARPKKNPEPEQPIDDGNSTLSTSNENDYLTLPPVVEEDIPMWSSEVTVAGDGMLGALVKLQVEGMKQMVRPWKQMSESEQQVLIDHFRFCAGPIIHEAMQTMAAKGRRVVFGRMESMAVKDSIKAVIGCEKSPEACAAFGMSAGGRPVALLLMEAEELLEEFNQVKADPDQPELPLDDGDPTANPFEEDQHRSIPEIALDLALSEECPA